ncbi:hypothetical protein ACFHW2_22350 [Actinomadura sp. LOL_016]|uniref:hypothetical protein n=1 Tax=unclassified Actinomadura TaxID=2626254 RepID=UPI003A80ED75
MRTAARPADALLAEIEPLAHADRRRRVADLRRLAGGRDLVPLLVDLGTRGPYEEDVPSLRDALAHAVDTADGPAVLRAIATERTDLLDLVLTDDLAPRRIDPAWTRRWTARQRTFLSLLDRRAKSG